MRTDQVLFVAKCHFPLLSMKLNRYDKEAVLDLNVGGDLH
jgi:hypothetical protein